MVSVTRFRLWLPATLAVSALLLVAAPALGFGGARLINTSIGLTFNGTAYPRVQCAGGTEGFCWGRLTVVRGGRVIGSAPIAIRSGDAPSVEVRLAGGRRDRILRGGRAVTVLIKTFDNDHNFSQTNQSATLKG